jgi:hypothetical protein
MTAAARRPASAAAWTRTRTPSGAWRLEHPKGSVIFVDRDASEDEVQRRMAEAESTIRRLIAGRKRP